VCPVASTADGPALQDKIRVGVSLVELMFCVHIAAYWDVVPCRLVGLD
jgi:hypothetical protein